METTGGQNWLAAFRVKIKSNKSGYDFLDKLTDAVVSGAVSLTNAACIFQLTESSKPSFQEDGTVKLALDQYEAGEEFWDFLNKVAVPGSAGSVKAVSLENGASIFGGASGEEVLFIGVFFPDDPAAPTKYFTVGGFGGVSANSGSFDTKYQEGIKPQLEFTGKKTQADLVVPVGAFPAMLTGVETTISNGYCYFRKYFAKAA